MQLAASIQQLERTYFLKGEIVRALRGVSFDVPEGDYIAIMGTSGSGKSTLLNLLGCLDTPTSGRILLGEDNVTELSDDGRAEIRASRIGFVFQSYNLMPQLTVLENIEVPLFYQRNLSTKVRKRCRELAELVGLGDRLNHRPTQLSGGQQQRVAIARSLVNDPYFILADEPTGNLDSATTEEILQLFDRLHDEGRTIMLVTHEDEVGARARRVIRLRDGQIAQDKLNPGKSPIGPEVHAPHHDISPIPEELSFGKPVPAVSDDLSFESSDVVENDDDDGPVWLELDEDSDYPE